MLERSDGLRTSARRSIRSAQPLACVASGAVLGLFGCDGAVTAPPRRPPEEEQDTTRCYRDECSTDADCLGGGVCDCGGGETGRNICTPTGAPGSCRVDSDCGPDGYCSPDDDQLGCGNSFIRLRQYFCHAPSDVCFNDSDCPVLDGWQQRCIFGPTRDGGQWQCGFHDEGCC
jgi:hypothetical protein